MLIYRCLVSSGTLDLDCEIEGPLCVEVCKTNTHTQIKPQQQQLLMWSIYKKIAQRTKTSSFPQPQRKKKLNIAE